MKLSAGFAVRMPGSAIIMYDVWSEKKQQKLFNKAQQKIKSIAPFIKEQKEYKVEKWSFFVNWIFNILNGPAMKNPPDKKYWIDENCNGCGICEIVCPSGNIKMINNKPEWFQSNCEQCLACLNWCPQQAIQYGKKKQVLSYTSADG